MTDLMVRPDAVAKRLDLADPAQVTAPSGGHNGLVSGGDLVTAVYASLFTWARANDDDELPNFSDDRKGWWGDSYPVVEGFKIGSRLWLLARRVITAETLALAKQYAEESLEWMVEDKVAREVIVQVGRDGPNRVNMLVTIVQPDGNAIEVRYIDLWAEIGAST